MHIPNNNFGMFYKGIFYKITTCYINLLDDAGNLTALESQYEFFYKEFEPYEYFNEYHGEISYA